MTATRSGRVILAAMCAIGGLVWLGTSTRPSSALGLPPTFSAAPDTFPNFDRTLALESTSETSANVSIGDVDGDGRLDIVLVKGRHWPLVDRVLLGDGAGHFATGYDLGTVADRSYSGRLVDMDGDGDLDVVVSNDKPDPKLVYLNDGKGHFHVGSTFGRPEWETRNASVADLNGDGLPDIVVANRSDSGGANYICFNKGGGRFDNDCVAFSREPATTITPADINGDGLIDLVVPYRDAGQSKVYLAGPKGTFSAARIIPFGPRDATIRMADVADFNGDGMLDIVTIDERRGTAIYFGQRGGTFSVGTQVSDSTITPYALAVRDLNGDGKPDVIVGNVEAPSAVYFNDGSGRRFVTIHFGDNKGAVYGFAIADLDRDGLLDIAVARSDAPNVVYFGGRAKQQGQSAPPTRDPNTPGFVTAKELPDGSVPPIDANGNFIIGPTHAPAPEMVVHDGVPRGAVHTFTMRSTDSKIFPGIARDSGTFGTVSPTDPATLVVTTSHPAPYTRTVAVYVPAQYVPGTIAPFIIGTDGPDQLLFVALDNLIAEKRVPPMIAISIGNGGGDAQGSERGLEYDTMSGRYAEFVETEVLPLVERQYNVKLTKDPEGRATMGGSSGGSAAFIMAWYHPELYHRILAYSITAINQQWPHSSETPHGAWGFHETLIPKSTVKPIRVWLEVGDRDFLNPNVMRDDMHDWVVASENMARVLAAKGYHYQFVFARNAGHVDRGVKQQTLPEALAWLWRGYAIDRSKRAGVGRAYLPRGRG